MIDPTRRSRRSALLRVAAAFAAAWLLVAPGAGAEESYRVESTQGRVERATGPQGLLGLAGQGKVTVRALMGWMLVKVNDRASRVKMPEPDNSLGIYRKADA